MVITRSLEIEEDPGTPDLTEDQRVQGQAEPPRVWQWSRSESRTTHFRQPLRPLKFEEELPAVHREQGFAMEVPRSGKDEVFTGRHGGLTLPEFEDRFLAIMAEIEMKAAADKFTEEFAILQMSRYLGGEASVVYRKYRPIVAAGKTKQGLSLTREDVGAAEDSKDKLVKKSMVEMMFEILRSEFPAHTQEKMEEITKFAFKPGENLKSAYLRLEQLMEDTDLRNPRDAAEDFLGALPYKQRMKVSDAVHLTHGKMYTLRQVYEMADRILPADAYSSAYYERRNHGVRGMQLGQSSSSSRERVPAVPTQAVRKERAANTASIIQPCARCLGAHFTRDCEYHWSGSRAREACPSCGRYGHTEQACWRSHPELRPANMGSVVTPDTTTGATASKDLEEKQQMLAMIAELQKKLDKALQANSSTRADTLSEDSDDAPSYMAMRKRRSMVNKVAKVVNVADSVLDEESEVRRQTRLFAKLPKSFEQRAGASSHPVKGEGQRAAGLGMTRLSTEIVLKRLMDAPCLSLNDIGMQGGDLRAAVHRWVAVQGLEPRGDQVQAHQAQTWELQHAPFEHKERMQRQGGVALVRNEGRHVEIEGYAPLKVLIDTGAEPVLLGKRVKMALGLYGSKLEDSSVKLSTSAGTKENVLGVTKHPLRIVLNPRKKGECEIRVKCLVTDAENYDVLMGSDATYWPAVGVDPYQELAFYRPGWQKGEYDEIATIPLDLHRRGYKGSTQAHLAEGEEESIEPATLKAEQKVDKSEYGEAEQLGTRAHHGQGSMCGANGAYPACSATGSGQEVVPDEHADLMDEKCGLYEPEKCLAADMLHTAVNGQIVTAEIMWKPPTQGIVLMELFAGISAGLEAVLKAGIKVRRYVYCDNNWNAQIVARERVKELQNRFPHLLTSDAVKGFQSALPSDVRLVGQAHLRALGMDVDMLIAGWECQGMSSAGKGEGLQDKQSALFAELVRVLKLIQKQSRPCWYIIENIPACFDRREKLRKDYQEVKSWLGEELLLDAVQFGSVAHRLRSFWTNIAGVQQLRALRAAAPITKGDLERVLEPGHRVQAVKKADKLPFLPLNMVGEPRRVWPTFVSASKSYAFRNGGAGTILNDQDEEIGEPTANERERAMGYMAGSTAVAGVSEANRKKLLGHAFDLNSVHWLVAEAMQYQLRKQGQQHWWPVVQSQNWTSQAATAVPEEGAERGNAVGDRVVINSVLPQLVPRPSKTTAPTYIQWDVNSSLSREEQQAVTQLLDRHRHVFAFSIAELGRYGRRKFSLQLNTTEPIFRRRHKLSKSEWDLVEEKCQELAQAGLIRKSESQYAAATVLPAKKDSEGNWTDRRMCGDYRPLNAATSQTVYPMPTPDDIFDAIGQAKYFTTLDMRQGFNQVLIEEADKAKTAFWGRDCLWEWETMPFGMKNASLFFQQVMDVELADMPFTRCYIDDVIVFSNTFEEHLQHLEAVLKKLEGCGLKAHPKKCRFAWQQIEYLGHLLVPGGIEPHMAKITAIMNMPRPEDVAALRAFLGLVNYYRKFCKDISRICKPLYDLLKKDSKWMWVQEHELAWLELKQQLIEYPMLARPDFNKAFSLYTDWSMIGIGAMLAQLDQNGEEKVVAFASRSNNTAESNYSSYEGECLAAVWGVLHFRPYIYGRTFQLITDHQPLHWLMTNAKLTGKLARWALLLSEYEMQIIHRAGRVHCNADGLSRNPMPSSQDITAARQDTGPLHATPSACLAYLPSQQQDQPGCVGLEESVRDIWGDAIAMQWLKEGSMPPGSSEKQLSRVKRRTQRYVWQNERLWLKGKIISRQVPAPSERRAIIEKAHAELGHFGVKRTHHMLRPQFFWAGMYANIEQVVAECAACDRVKARFTAADLVLHSLPIRGLFFRWSLDLMPELPKSRSGNKHCLLMIEHFSKWAEVAVFPTKSSRNTARAFLQCVLSRFGSCAEVLTDQGTEFRGEFQQLLDRSLIDHRRTSRDHPQADGLAERLVQTVKDALRKYCMEVAPDRWDELLPYIMLGYRVSVQAALANFSPYYLLLGRNPILPNVAPDSITREVDWSTDVEQCLQELLERAQIFERIIPMAMENLAIAQHRDQLRYAFTRGGSWKPKARKFQTGDFVYLQHKQQNTLDVGTGRVVLRVVAVSDQAIAELEGQDGRRWKEHVKHLAPCHLPNLDTTLKPSAWRPPIDLPCELCGHVEDADVMLLCDRCNKAFHMFCLQPPLLEVPESDWFCNACQTLTQ